MKEVVDPQKNNNNESVHYDMKMEQLKSQMQRKPNYFFFFPFLSFE